MASPQALDVSTFFNDARTLTNFFALSQGIQYVLSMRTRFADSHTHHSQVTGLGTPNFAAILKAAGL